MGFKEKLLAFKAKRKGLTTKEYQELQEDLKQKRKEEQRKFELFKVGEEYRQKQRHYRQSKARGRGSTLEKFANYAKRVNENVTTMYGLSPPRKKSKKRRTKRRKKRR